MTQTANLTVGISTLERPGGVARCLDAILAGTALPAEIIVVDQSSGEATQVAVEQRRTGLVPIVYHRQQRRGLSASRNAVLARASCPVIAVTDDDCVPSPQWITAIDRAFRSPAAPDVVTGRVLPLGPEVPGLYAVSSRTSAVPAIFTGNVVPWVAGTGGNCAVKREWIERIGRYDERLGAGSPGGAGEDLDWLYRLLRAGARIQYEPEVLIYHERQSKARRIATRSSYGRGAGACCGVWLRRGDVHALRMLGYWMILRTRLMVRAVRRRQWSIVYEELLVQRGTVAGLLYGIRA